MRYHLESYLPIEAFKPRGGVFGGGMTLHGGGGGIISAVTDTISNALGTAGGQSGVLGALADFDDAVSTSVDGGWGGLAETAAVMAATYFGGPLGGAAARGAFDYTHGGEDRKNALRNAAEQAVVSYAGGQGGALGAGATKAAFEYTHGGEDRENALKSGLTTAGTQFAMQGAKDYFGDPDAEVPVTDNSDFTYSPDYAPPPDIDLNTPYIDAPDGEVLLTPDSGADSTFIPKGILSPEEQFAKDNYVPPELRSPDYVEPTYIPSELNLDNLYQNLPDGATQLGYSPDQLAAITSSSMPPALSQEEQYEKFYKEFLNNPQNPRPNFLDDPLKNISNRASDTLDYLQNAPENAYKYLRDTPIKEMGSDLYDFAGRNKLELGLGALALSSMGGQQPQPQGQPTAADSRYTGGYGSSGGVASPYLLRNRITASNVYDYENPFDRYATVNRRYAKGGEVKHFAFGGISNALTRFTQPIEKAIVQPVGQALPFLKDVAPYAGILAAPFITNPAMAVGVGALSSGFGRPGTGFDMKRALMGGIAAYGASTLGAGVEAAGTEPTKPLVDTLAESYAVPGTEVPVSTAAPKGFFRDTDAMQKGVGNLLSSDSDAATKAFSTKADTFKSGVPIVMGTSGMMAIDEANKMREEAERSAGAGRQEQADMLARISKGRKRAEQAVRENPYMYAMGGQVDDELGGDYSAMGMDQGNLQKGLFGMGYKEGGNVSKKSTRLEDNLPELNDNFKETDFEKRLEPSIFRLTGAPNSLIDNPYVKGITGRVGGSYVVDRDTQLTAGLGGFAGRNPSGYTIKPESADVGIVRKMGPGYLAAQYQRNLMGNRAGDRIMANYAIPFAEGGTPRFLSGGGDGMSDSIPATIEGKQEARLADGEFVIPADVVSHLGNGSSKAGAKQLYSMMDRVRKARTGNEKQGRQIKPNKMMPA